MIYHNFSVFLRKAGRGISISSKTWKGYQYFFEMNPQEKLFKFCLVNETGEETFTFRAKPNDESIEEALWSLNEDFRISFRNPARNFKLHLEYEDCNCISHSCRCNEHKGHFVTLDRWEYPNPMRAWEGKTVRYYTELLIEDVNKKGDVIFYRYYDDPRTY